MVQCSHCTTDFTDDDTYITHLIEEHPEDLTRIDKRRIENHPGATVPDPDTEEMSTAAFALQTILNIIFIAIAAALMYALYYAAVNGLIY